MVYVSKGIPMQSADGEGTLEVSAVLCHNLYLYVEQRMGTGHIAFVLLEFFYIKFVLNFPQNLEN